MRLYQPSNGTEGFEFQCRFCDHCRRHRGGRCAILIASMTHDLSDKDYPAQWRYDDEGKPTCTAFAPVVMQPAQREPKPKRPIDGQQPLF